MKKLLIALFSILILAGCANDPYKIDPVATANAPWEVGEVVHRYRTEENDNIHITFLGVTEDGYFIVQDFYSDEEKSLSDPYIVMNKEAMDFEMPPLYHGRKVLYHLNGQVRSDCTFSHGSIKSPPCISLDEFGNIASEYIVTYDDNIRFSEVISYENNAISREARTVTNYGIGVRASAYTRYYPSGQKMAERSYQNDKPTGIWRTWDENGSLIEETDYGTP